MLKSLKSLASLTAGIRKSRHNVAGNSKKVVHP